MRDHTRIAGCLLLASLAVGAAPAHAQSNATWPAVTVPPAVSATATKDAALIIGIDQYAFVPHVDGAAANARDWFTFLVEGQKLPIARAHLIRDREATREQILEAAKRAGSEVEPGGRLWIIFIGHGAPAADGKDGVLVGVDAQQTAAGLYARSVAQRELLDAVSGGAQAQTILVLDACFSGRTSSGAPIAPGLQPIVRIADAGPLPKATTILSAGTSDQFAGPLPGTQRPAFSYLVLGALRGWGDKAGSGEVTAEDAVGYAKLVLTVVPLGRSQTPQIQGPGTRLLLSQGAREKGPSLTSVVGGGELPVVNPEVPPNASLGSGLSRVRVRATCGADPRPVASRQGLVVEEVRDTADAILKPVSDPNASLKYDSATRSRVMTDPEFVEYELPAGVHRLRVRSKRCSAHEEEVALPGGKTVELAPKLTATAIPMMFRRPAFASDGDLFRVLDDQGKVLCSGFPCSLKVPPGSGYALVWDRGGSELRTALQDPVVVTEGAEPKEMEALVTRSRSVSLPGVIVGGAGLVVAVGTGFILTVGLLTNEGALFKRCVLPAGGSLDGPCNGITGGKTETTPFLGTLLGVGGGALGVAAIGGLMILAGVGSQERLSVSYRERSKESSGLKLRLMPSGIGGTF